MDMIGEGADFAVMVFPLFPGDGLETLLADRYPTVLARGSIVGMRVQGNAFFFMIDKLDLELKIKKDIIMNMKIGSLEVILRSYASFSGKALLIKDIGTRGSMRFFVD